MPMTAFGLFGFVTIGYVMMYEAFELSENCKWNSTLKNTYGIDTYNVEYRNLGRVSDCGWIYKRVLSHKMKQGPPNFIRTKLNRVSDVTQRISLSWYLERNIQEYLLILKLMRRENNFTINPNETVCLYVEVEQAHAEIQFQQNYNINFDCIQVATGTIGAALEMILYKNPVGKQVCSMERTTAKPCFRSGPELYTANIEANCCPLYKAELRIVQDNCKEIILSVSNNGLSAVTYILRASNGSLVDMGHLVGIENRADKLFLKKIPFVTPDIFSIWVSFWCSFNPDKKTEDHACSTDELSIDASLCKTILHAPDTDKGDEIKVSPAVATVVTLACVAFVVVIAVVLFFYKRDSTQCRTRNVQNRRNNENPVGEPETQPKETASFLTSGDSEDDREVIPNAIAEKTAVHIDR